VLPRVVQKARKSAKRRKKVTEAQKKEQGNEARVRKQFAVRTRVH
jgi:hypothetical protein